VYIVPVWSDLRDREMCRGRHISFWLLIHPGELYPSYEGWITNEGFRESMTTFVSSGKSGQSRIMLLRKLVLPERRFCGERDSKTGGARCRLRCCLLTHAFSSKKLNHNSQPTSSRVMVQFRQVLFRRCFSGCEIVTNASFIIGCLGKPAVTGQFNVTISVTLQRTRDIIVSLIL
jgi:hypothetical protein